MVSSDRAACSERSTACACAATDRYAVGRSDARRRGSLVAERLDRVETRGAPRGPDAEADADQRREPERDDHRVRADRGRPMEERAEPERAAAAQDDARET